MEARRHDTSIHFGSRIRNHRDGRSYSHSDSHSAHRLMRPFLVPWLAFALLLVGPLGSAARAEQDFDSSDVYGLEEPALDEAGRPTHESRWHTLGAGALDLLVLRPARAVATLAGLGYFVVAAPLVAPSGEIGTAWDTFFYTPMDEAFQRPLGEF